MEINLGKIIRGFFGKKTPATGIDARSAPQNGDNRYNLIEEIKAAEARGDYERVKELTEVPMGPTNGRSYKTPAEMGADIGW